MGQNYATLALRKLGPRSENPNRSGGREAVELLALTVWFPWIGPAQRTLRSRWRTLSALSYLPR